MDELTIWGAMSQAATDLITSDVPGSLLVMSLALNFVLLAPYVIKAIRSSYRVNK